MAKSGQARVPTTEEWKRVFEVIQDHRHPEKNTAIMQISAKLGLRAQEIALLQIKEVARLKKSGFQKISGCNYPLTGPKSLKIQALMPSFFNGRFKPGNTYYSSAPGC